MKAKLLKETPISGAELRDFLENLQKSEELNFRAQKTLDHLQSVNVLSKSEAEKFLEKIQKLGISKLKEKHLQKLVDLPPKTIDDVKTVLQSYNLNLTADKIKKLTE